MNRSGKLFCQGAVLAVCWVLAGAQVVGAAPPPTNLLLNPGFELDTNNDGKPDNWTSNGKFTRSTAVMRSGSYAGRHFATNNAGYTISQTVNNLTAGTTYGFSGWVNIPPTSDIFTFKFQVKWRNASNKAISTQTIKTHTAATNGWVEAVAGLVAPTGTTNALVQMDVSSLNATIYVDDLAFGPSASFDFSLTNANGTTPPSGDLTVTQGLSGTNTITTTLVSGPAQVVSFDPVAGVSGLPAGATAAFSPTSSCTPTCSTTLTITTVFPTTPTGSFLITVTGSAGALSHTTTFTLIVNAAPFDFALANANGTTPPSGDLTVTQGLSGANTVTATRLAGTAQVVSFDAVTGVSGLPTGATAAFSPTSSCTPTCSTTLTITTLATTPTGPATITVTGSAGALSHTTTFTLTVNAAPFDFALANANGTTPPSGDLTVTQGLSGANTVTATRLAGTAQVVSFDAVTGVSGLPTGATASFSPTSSCTPTCSTTLTITTVFPTTPTGSFLITVTGSAGALSHTTTFTLTVNAAPFDFALANANGTTPPSGDLTVTQGLSGANTVTATRLAGTAQVVSFDAVTGVSGLPTGATASFSPTSSCTPTCSTTLTITTLATTPTGPATITVTGSAGALSHTTTFTLTVNAAPFDFALANANGTTPPSGDLTVTQGLSGTNTVTATRLAGTAQVVSFDAVTGVSGLPTGATASFSPTSSCTPTCSTTLTITTVFPTTPTGSFLITVTGSAGALSHTTTFTLIVNAAPFDFALANANGTTPPSGDLTVTQGLSGANTVTATRLAGTAQVVSFDAVTGVSGLPTGATASFSPTSSCTPTCSTTLTITTLATTPTGPATITVTGSAGALSHTTTFTLTVNAAAPPNLLLNPGFELATNGVNPDNWTTDSRFTRSNTVVLSGSFAGRHFATDNSSYNISQTVNNLSAGTTYNFSGWVNIPATSDAFTFQFKVRWRNGNTAIITQTIRTYNAATSGWNSAVASLVAPTGTTNAQVLMVVSSLNATIYVDNLSLVVFGTAPAFDFALANSNGTTPPSGDLTVPQGAAGSNTITATLLSGTAQAVTFSVTSPSPLPPGVTVSFLNNPCIPTCTTTLTITTLPSTPTGTYPVVVTGTGGGLTSLTNFTLLVTPLAPGGVAFAVPTFESAGFYWKPANGSAATECTIQFRVQGTSTWKQGLPLWFDDRNGEYRGSLVYLNPGTTYEANLQLVGADTSTSLTFTTWSEYFPVAQTFVLPPNSNQTLNITQSGSPSGYILYSAPSQGSATIDVANAQDNDIVVSASYVIIRGLTLKGAIANGINLTNGANHVVIEENDISGWGTNLSDGWGAPKNDGVLCDHDMGVSNIIIQRNKIHNPRSNANNWNQPRPAFGGDPHPAGPRAIGWDFCGGNNVIRYNEAWGDINHHFIDGMGGAPDDGVPGFPGPDSDLYGNIIQDANDDGLEVEGSGRNVRVWNNYVDNTFTGISSTSTVEGPLYIFRNIYDRSRKDDDPALDSDNLTTFKRGPFGKSGDGTSNGSGNARRYWFHNTILQRTALGKTLPLGGGGVYSQDGPLEHAVSRNNIFNVFSSAAHSVDGGSTNDFDYDLYNGIKLPSTAESHGTEGMPTYAPGNGDNAGASGLYQLAPSSLGFDTALRIPNFNDNFLGAGPDIGAAEAGAPAMQFGVNAAGTGTP